MVEEEQLDEPQSLYDILGVDEFASQDALVKAYRQRALEEHPDKGGDAGHFDDLVKAFKVLSVVESREAYDQELAKSRQKSKLVEGGRAQPAGPSAKQAEAPMREKTAPHAGSKRQGKLHSFEPGKEGHCANEWKGMGSGGQFLKMIADDVTEEEKIERLFQKYASLPPGKEKKREWCNSLRGQERRDLKTLAKKKEEQQKAKLSVWLNHGPSGAPVRRQMNKEARAEAAQAEAEAARRRKAAPTVATEENTEPTAEDAQ